MTEKKSEPKLLPLELIGILKIISRSIDELVQFDAVQEIIHSSVQYNIAKKIYELLYE